MGILLRLTKLRLPADDDARLSRLLDEQQAVNLSAEGQGELFELMRRYEEYLLRQAEALAEAVRRGLRQPLAS